MVVRVFILILCAFLVQGADPPVSDQQIEASLQQRLAKSTIREEGFTVRVKDGVVYWSGTTSVPQRKGAATRMANSAGARRVVNNIRVTGAKAPSPAKPKAAAAPSAKPVVAPAPTIPTDTAPMKRAKVQWVPVRH